MIGRVAGRQPQLDVALLMPDQTRIEIGFVVDTGFDGYLTLPPQAITALNLPFRQIIEANLADGIDYQVSLYTAIILWNGEPCEVPVLALGKRPLLGTALLESQELIIQFVEDGSVTLKEISAPSP